MNPVLREFLNALILIILKLIRHERNLAHEQTRLQIHTSAVWNLQLAEQAA
jgi:hypothetical protein